MRSSLSLEEFSQTRVRDDIAGGGKLIPMEMKVRQ